MAVGTPHHFASRGKHLHHSTYDSKTRLPALKWLPPVLRSLASLIDYIASYKLSMVHKLCSSERYTPQRRPVATRVATLRSPRLCSLCLDKDLLSQLCDQIPGLEKTSGEIGVKEKFKTRCIFCACYSTLQRWHWFPVKNRADNPIWQWTPHRLSVLCVLYLWNLLNLKMFCKSHQNRTQRPTNHLKTL